MVSKSSGSGFDSGVEEKAVVERGVSNSGYSFARQRKFGAEGVRMDVEGGQQSVSKGSFSLRNEEQKEDAANGLAVCD